MRRDLRTGRERGKARRGEETQEAQVSGQEALCLPHSYSPCTATSLAVSVRRRAGRWRTGRRACFVWGALGTFQSPEHPGREVFLFHCWLSLPNETVKAGPSGPSGQQAPLAQFPPGNGLKRPFPTLDCSFPGSFPGGQQAHYHTRRHSSQPALEAASHCRVTAPSSCPFSRPGFSKYPCAPMRTFCLLSARCSLSSSLLRLQWFSRTTTWPGKMCPFN